MHKDEITQQCKLAIHLCFAVINSPNKGDSIKFLHEIQYKISEFVC